MSGERAVQRVVAHLLRHTRVPLLAALLVTWIAGGIAVLPRFAAPTSANFGVLLGVALCIGTVGALGGLVLYWSVAEEVEFARRGYRIRQLPPREYLRWTPGPKDWIYEELAQGTVRGLSFVRVVIRSGYPAESDVLLPDASSWDDRMPKWACGRRAEIVERVLAAAGRSATRVRAA